MANYNNQGGGNRFGGDSRPKFGGNSFRKPAFGKKSWSDRPVTMHKAVCAECSKTCEVPFRPNGEKPVYCNECFGGKGGNTGGERFVRKDSHVPTRPSFENNKGSDAVMKQLETMNVKLERLIQAVESLSSSKPVKVNEELKEVLSVVSKKNSKKKPAKK